MDMTSWGALLAGTQNIIYDMKEKWENHAAVGLSHFRHFLEAPHHASSAGHSHTHSQINKKGNWEVSQTQCTLSSYSTITITMTLSVLLLTKYPRQVGGVYAWTSTHRQKKISTWKHKVGSVFSVLYNIVVRYCSHTGPDPAQWLELIPSSFNHQFNVLFICIIY